MNLVRVRLQSLGALWPGRGQGVMDTGVKACTFPPGLKRDIVFGESSQMLQIKQPLVSRALGVRCSKVEATARSIKVRPPLQNSWRVT